ncbi:MAG TPA: STN and carboxypeptidase regulatory-like domain-containing protein [Flavipsychrobacter sp.]
MNYLYRLAILLLFIIIAGHSYAQSLLNKQVNIDIKGKKVTEALKIISRQGNFYFSYNSNIIRRDTAVNLSIRNKTVRQVLDMLFDGMYDYTESGNHIIIESTANQYWYATGYVADATTGEKLPYASVYERRQFVSTMTNEQGYFKLKLKDRQAAANLYISKSWYHDTIIVCRANYNTELSVALASQAFELDSFVVTQHTGVERNWFGRLFLSSRQRMQSINLSKYFVNKPYQGSVLPGLSTQGKLSTQVVNKFSFNLLGGYTAGVNGFELGGLFNIVKKDVRYAQVAGLFNLAGGALDGFQIAGLHNNILDTATGVQVAGISNYAKGKVIGSQVSGIYNHSSGNVRGVQVGGVASFAKDGVDGGQVAGVFNYTNKKTDGVQVAGVANSIMGELDGVQVSGVVNHVNKDVDGVQVAGVINSTLGVMTGVQVSGVFNFAKDVRGMQIGLINIADTSSGMSIGFINFIWKGYHKLTITTSEAMNVNAAIKLGNKKLYNILFAGLNAGSFQQVFGLGYGLGQELKISKRFSISSEISMQYLHLGDWEASNWLYKGQVNLNYKLHKFIAITGGPSYNFYNTNQNSFQQAFRKDLRTSGIAPMQHDRNWYSWIGWNVGLTFF